LLHEHGGDGILIDRAGGPVPLGTLIPDAFGPEAIP
jgi:cytidine deaminase